MSIELWFAVVGAILAVVGIWATVVAYRKTRPAKTIDFEIVQSERFLAEHSSLTRLHMFWGDDFETGAPVQHPTIIRLRFTNSGTMEIPAKDFEDEPIAITTIGARMIEATVTEVSHSTIHALGPLSVMRGQSTALAPNGLELKEYIEVLITLDGGEDIQVTSRVRGQTRPIRRLSHDPRPSPHVTRAAAMFVSGYMVGGFQLLFEYGHISVAVIMGIVGAGIGVVTLLSVRRR